jgi:coenzyme F420-dependent glucose-6-phosphate dehydrogenase
MVQVGWKAGTEQYPPGELLDYAVLAEEAGFDSIDVSDHFHPWAEAGQASFTWTWLGAAAVRTRRIVLGPGVTCPILRYHPSIIAQASATLASFAPGRTYLAVGTGEALNEYSATGMWPEYAERRDRLAEAIDLIRELWTGQPVSFRGRFYRTEKAKLYTPPPQPIPLLVSAMAPDSARFAGRHSDGLMTVGGKRPQLYQQITAEFEEGARAAQKDPARLTRAIEVRAAITEDTQGAIQAVLRYWAGTYIPALFVEKIYTPAQSEMNGEAIGADVVQKTSCISPDPETHVQFLRRYMDMGFDTIYVHCAGPDQREFLERYGRDVIPKLRSAASVGDGREPARTR